MAEAKIDVLGPYDAAIVVDLYNQVFAPPRDAEHFERRFKGRHNVAVMIASLDERPVGFLIGFELSPTTYFIWMCGVLPDFRRAGIATQLVAGQEAWARDQHYGTLRFECNNQHRPMLHVAIQEGYDLVGMRWDTESAANVAIFEKSI